MRKNGLGLMTTVKGDRKPTAFIEDAAVPLEVLPDYIEQVLAICARHERPVTLYAHASVGLLHVRPMLDLHHPSEIADLRKIAFERANDSDPDTAAHWALPHHPSPGADADPAGVSAALGALNGARGGAPDLKSKEAAQAHLENHQGAGEKAAGNAEHLYEALAFGKADAALAASIFHYRETTVDEVKALLAARGVPVRIR
jgi:hypothetical protein